MPGPKGLDFSAVFRRVKTRRFLRRLAPRGLGVRLVFVVDSWNPTSAKTGQMWETRGQRRWSVSFDRQLRVRCVPASPKWRLAEFGYVPHRVDVISNVDPAGDRESAPLLFTVPCNDRAGHLLNLGEDILLALAVSSLVRELPLVNAKSHAVNVGSVENNSKVSSRWIRGEQRYHGRSALSLRGKFDRSCTGREFIYELLK